MGVLGKIAGFFTGGVGSAATDMAGGIADIVERWKPGESKKHEMEQEINEFVHKTVDSARKHDVPLNSGLAWVDGLVNGVNRLIRPWVTIMILGALFGYWELPSTSDLAPEYWQMAMIVLGFWFGGRFLVKDIPQALKSMVR